MIKTDNFNPDTDPKLLCTCEHPECDQRSVDQSTLDQVQRIREDLDRAMTVTSGGRCPDHPDELAKDEPGDHQLCKGIDIECHDEMHETKLKVLAGRHGATRVAGGAYCGFVHLAWTTPARADVPTWSY